MSTLMLFGAVILGTFVGGLVNVFVLDPWKRRVEAKWHRENPR